MSDNNNSSNRRNFLTNVTKVVGGVGEIFAAIPFLSSMSPSEKTKMAGAPIEIDIYLQSNLVHLKLLNGEESLFG